MRRILFSLIIIIALLGNINIAEAQYAHPATAIKSTNGNVQSDLNTLQANIASNTAEIEAINQNLATHEAELASITAEINLMSVNLGTIEIRLDSIESNILSMIEPAITELRLNLSTIEDLINSNYNSLFANLETHENELNDIKNNIATHETSLLALQTNDETQETRIESNEVALLADIVNLATNYWTAAATKLYVDATDEIIIADLDSAEAKINSLDIISDSQSVAIEAVKVKADSNEVGIDAHIDNLTNPHQVTATQTPYTDTYSIGATELQAAIDTVSVWLASVDLRLDSSEIAINLLNIDNDSQDISIESNRLALVDVNIELDSISVAINNLDLRLGAIELILASGSSGEVLTKTDDSFTWETIPAGVTDHLLLSNIGTKTHLELEQDIADLQANPAGISRVYIDGVALPTGEVEFVSGDNVTLNVSGSTVEVVATGGGGSVATVEITLNQDYTARAQGTAEAGFYSIYDFSVKYSDIVVGTIQPTINGLAQYEDIQFTVSTWDDSGTNRLRITFADDVSADALVRVSYCTTLPTFEGQATLEDIGVYVSDNKIWDFSDLYELNTIALLRNGIYQKKALYNTSIEANKTRVTFVSAVNTTDEVIIIGTPSSLQSTEDIATYVSDNTIWDFTDDFDPLKVYIYRNGVYQKRSLFTTSVVSDKLRVTFGSAINTTDEISLIYIQ